MPFVFSRRYIQRCLDLLRVHLTPRQYIDLVAKLNRRSPERFPAMWETIVLACFAEQPDFLHEEPLSNGRAPDLQFRLRNSGARVVGEITAVSDNGARKENPIDQLMGEIDRVAKKYGSDRSQFDVYVNARDVGEYRKRRVILKLPKGPDREEFLQKELIPYIRERLDALDYGHKKIFRSGDYDVEVTFKPKSQFASYGHPSFKSALHIDRNPIWSALKAKADQLRGSPHDAVRLLVLCDGGCEAMRERGLSPGIGSKEIIMDFLRRETGIDIVVSMTVKDERQPLGQADRVHAWSWYVKPAWLQSDARNLGVATELQEVINAFGAQIPRPTSNAESSVKNCLTMDYGIGAWGGYKMSANKFEVSARALQRVLAGDVSVEEFNREYGTPNGNRFAVALANGQTISRVSMTRKDENDDDYLEVTFAPDAALSPFR